MLNFIIVLLVVIVILFNARLKIKKKGLVNYKRLQEKDKTTSQAVAEFNTSKKVILNGTDPSIEINKFINSLIIERKQEQKVMKNILRDSFLMFVYGSDLLAKNYAESKYQIDIINRMLELSYNLRYKLNRDKDVKGT